MAQIGFVRRTRCSNRYLLNQLINGIVERHVEPPNLSYILARVVQDRGLIEGSRTSPPLALQSQMPPQNSKSAYGAPRTIYPFAAADRGSFGFLHSSQPPRSTGAGAGALGAISYPAVGAAHLADGAVLAVLPVLHGSRGFGDFFLRP